MSNFCLNLIQRVYRKVHRLILRKRLKNQNFSILAPTCIAGVMYHDLGCQFLSPTIDLWMYDKDFYRFVTHLKEYLSYDLAFVQGIDETPTAYLNDILIHFNHYHSEQEAKEKWDSRKKRINYDNLFIIAADQPDGGVITEEDIASLSKVDCVNKKVFTIKDYPQFDYTMKLPKDEKKDCVNMYMLDKTSILDRYVWEKKFDYVKWLNTSKPRPE